MKFPYLQYAIQDGPSDYVFRPVIPVDLAGPDGEIDFYALVDTGSDDTLIPRYVADELGLGIDDDRVGEVTGIGGEKIPVAKADVELRVSDGDSAALWNASVGVIGDGDGGGDYVILGHKSCLEFFTATFAGDGRTLELTPNNTFPGTVDRSVEEG
jgi:hypothetical protein